MTRAGDHDHPHVLRVAGAQIENVVGDIDGNRRRISEAMAWAEEREADVLVLPELALTGYPLSDLALREDFLEAAADALRRLASESGSTVTVLSTTDRVPPRRGSDTQPRTVAIGAALLSDGEVRGVYHKVLLPTYETFEEGRYFAAGDRPDATWRIGGVVAGVSICEDAWSDDGPPEAQAAAGAQVLLVPNASPFHREKPAGRLRLVRRVAKRNGVPFVYVNSVGGQDDLVFDGGSVVVDGDGELLYRAPQFAAERFVLDVPVAQPRPLLARPATIHTRVRPPRAPEPPPAPAEQLDAMEQVWRALVRGTRDFVRRTEFDGAVVALSGGIDSALTTAVAAEALGPESVLALAMPGRHTEDAETAAARRVAATLGVELRVVPIEGLRSARDIIDAVGERPARLTEEDLEMRLRGALLMAVAEELGRIALATGNKTELSIGAGVLFGDMAGNFSPLRDCPKTLLYDLARHLDPDVVFPEETLRHPSIRMRTDELPPYGVLDAIVERYVERGQGLSGIVAAGFDPAMARGVLQLVDDAEFKRRQIAPGVKITSRAFAGDRRMPIANAWSPFRSEELDLASAVESHDGAATAPVRGE